MVKTGIMAGLYRHYKGGYYQVLGVAQHTETDEVGVVYVSLDASMPGPRIRFRPLYGEKGWLTPEDGKPRFEYRGEEVVDRG